MTLAASRELTETGPQCHVNVSTATGAKEQEIARFNVQEIRFCTWISVQKSIFKLSVFPHIG